MMAPAGCPPTKKITHAHTYIHWERYGHLRTRKTIEITTHTHTQEKRRNFDRASSHSAPTGYKHKYTCVSLTWGECFFFKSHKLFPMLFLSPELKRNVMQSCTSGGGTRNLKRKGEKKKKKFSSFLYVQRFTRTDSSCVVAIKIKGGPQQQGRIGFQTPKVYDAPSSCHLGNYHHLLLWPGLKEKKLGQSRSRWSQGKKSYQGMASNKNGGIGIKFVSNSTKKTDR